MMRNEGTNTQETDNELDRPSSMSDTDAQRTPTIMGKLKNWAGAQYLAVALLATPALTGCEPKAAPTPIETIDTRPETEKYTPAQWLAKVGIKPEQVPNGGLGAITMINTPVKGQDGMYYVQVDMRLNKDVIKALGLKVVETSKRPIDEMYVYVNFDDIGATGLGQGFEKSYADIISTESELRASQLTDVTHT